MFNYLDYLVAMIPRISEDVIIKIAKLIKVNIEKLGYDEKKIKDLAKWNWFKKHYEKTVREKMSNINIMGLWIGNTYGTHPLNVFAEFNFKNKEVLVSIKCAASGS